MERLLLSLGMPRCGTTWMHRQLIDSPGIHGIARKELHYFMSRYGQVDWLTDGIRQRNFKQFANGVSVIQRMDPQKSDPGGFDVWAPGGENDRMFQAFHEGLDWHLRFLQGPVCDAWYRRLFQRVPAQGWAIDFSTTNSMISDEGFARMARFAADTRGILVLRHPLDRLWSHILLQARVTGVSEQVEGWTRGEVNEFVRQNRLFEPALYGPVVARTLQHFAPEQRLILSFEAVMESPVALLSGVFDFLDLDLPESAKARTMARDRAPTRQARHERLVDFIHPCLRDLEQVAALGIDFVAPWIEDLTRRQSERDPERLFAATPVLLPMAPPEPAPDEHPSDDQAASSIQTGT